MTGTLYYISLIIAYFITAFIARYLSIRLYQSNPGWYKTHIFVSMNCIYAIMIVIFNWFFEINSTPIVLFIAGGVLIYLYADYLKEEN